MKRFALAASTLALFDFSTRSLEDFSGRNIDLSGTAVWREVAPQVFELAPGSDVSRPVRDAELALTGEMTVEVTGRFYSAQTQQAFASFTASGDTLAASAHRPGASPDSRALRARHGLRVVSRHGSISSRVQPHSLI